MFQLIKKYFLICHLKLSNFFVYTNTISKNKGETFSVEQPKLLKIPSAHMKGEKLGTVSQKTIKGI